MKPFKIFAKAWKLQHEEKFEKSHKVWLSLDDEGKMWWSCGTEAAEHMSSSEDPKEIFKKYYK